jgi:AraC family transcriptional regulator, positive regulator of tynA and feaB
MIGAPRLHYDEWMSLVQTSCANDFKGVEPKAFVGWCRGVNMSGFPAFDAECNIPTIERTQRHARLDGLAHYSVIFHLSGRFAVAQNEQRIELGVGDFVVVDPTRPMTVTRSGTARQLALHLPRERLVSHLGFEPRSCLWNSGTIAGRLLFQLAQEAINDTGPLPMHAEAYMRLAVYDLLGATFAPPDPRLASGQSGQFFAQIGRIIKDRFSDPDVSPADIATEAGISLRYMQKLFAARGSTFSHIIQSLRLDRAAMLLQRRALLDANQPLSEIAYASGFRDYPYFCRKFHERFGHPPSAHAESGGVDAGI